MCIRDSYKDSPDERLGLRTEVVDGVGCGSAGRVHRIFHGGLIEEWNRMAVACGMPDWEVEVNDVIIGVNGRMVPRKMFGQLFG